MVSSAWCRLPRPVVPRSRARHNTGVTPNPTPAELLAAPTYWTARAMQEQGSRFFQALGQALEAADLGNRRLIYQTWPAECGDFYRRGLLLAQAEAGEAPGA